MPKPTKLFAVLFAAASLLLSQGRGFPPGETSPNLPAQKIGPRDLIAIQVYDSPELTRTVRIGADGFVRLPMLKQRIKAEGLMPSDLEAAVSTALQEEGLIVEPFVTITVAEYSSRPISVAGAVKTPLTFQASSPVTLLEAITRAGGLTSETGSEILISKVQPGPNGDQTSLIQRVSVKSLIDAADPDANIQLSGGEEVRVPEAGRVFVVGNVKKPGAFAVQDGAESSVLRMLAIAEGLAPFAGKQAYIYRREGNGTKNEIPIELSKIMDRKAPDATLLPNDVLYIPDNRGKRFGLATLERVLMFGTTAGATALLYGLLGDHMPDNHNITALLPAPAEEMSGRNMPVPFEVYRAPFSGPEVETAPASVPLSHYLWLLRRHWWKILGFVILSVAASIVVSSRLIPIYESTAIVDIDRQMPSAIIGQESTRSMANDSDQFLATQIKLIQSDGVLRPVAQRFKLVEFDVPAGESLITRAAAEEAPVLLKDLKVVRPANTYLLLISYRSTDPKLAADVANAIARSYLEHTYNIRFKSSASLSAFMERQLEELKAKMERSSAALAQFERELNVISPEQKTSILSARLLQLNTEYTNAQADRVRKESAFKSVSSGTLESAQVSTQGESLKRLSEQLDAQQQKFAEVKSHFGPNHPEYRKSAVAIAEIQHQLLQARENIGSRVEVEFREAANRESMLGKAVTETKSEFDALNARSFEYQAKKREADGDKTLYEELVRKIREASINSGFQNSAIRIADTARAAIRPVFPNMHLNVLLTLLFSLLVSAGAAVLADMLNNTVRDPEQIARQLSTEVVGTLPAVKEWQGRAILSGSSGASLVPYTGTSGRALSSFEEAVRTLRNSILLTDFDRRIRSLLVTSSAPSEGKSTTAANLAMAHAQQGKRTLLIDGDLRRPSIHRRFDFSPTVGLSNVLTHGVPWRSVLLKKDELPLLDILPVGPPSRRAADMVGTGLAAILEEASAEYDLVVLDSPPLLGFPEPLQMAAAVDGVIVVAVAGRTNRKALGSAVNTLKRLRANIVGIVLNEVRADSSDTYYYHHYHPKYYKHYSTEATEG